MSASLPRSSGTALASPPLLRFGAAAPGAGVEWLLRRNCSITPGQMIRAYIALCLVSLTVASAFWWQGARFVMPFAWFELAALGLALLVFTRHAGDRERIAWRDGRLTVELVDGSRVRCIELPAEWVRVETRVEGRALIGLCSGRQRVAIGRHVRPEWRPLLADELRSVLRSGPVRPSRDD